MIAPARDCELCPRLVAYRAENAASMPEGWNAPVPAFGALDAPLLIVGLAPGRMGANRTARPFTGDGAGDLLYPALIARGLAAGFYQKRADDGLTLAGVRITNAVRCAPPENKAIAAEIRTCSRFLKAEIAAMPALRAILVLGRVAHDASLAALGLKKTAAGFAHGAQTPLPGGRTLCASFHCSRYNVSTKRLTPAMFAAAIDAAAKAAGL